MRSAIAGTLFVLGCLSFFFVGVTPYLQLFWKISWDLVLAWIHGLVIFGFLAIVASVILQIKNWQKKGEW